MQHQEALAQGLLPQPGSGGRGRSRTNKAGPPPVEPLTPEQLNNLQHGSGSITDPDIINILTQVSNNFNCYYHSLTMSIIAITFFLLP